MSGSVEYGIRIKIDGNRASAEAIRQVKTETAELSESAKQAGKNTSEAMQLVSSTAKSTAQAVKSASKESAAAFRDTQEAAAAAAKAGRSASESLSIKVNPKPLEDAAKNFKQTELSARQMSAAMRNVPAQMTDIITSLQAGQAPMTVLLQQGGQLKDMFGGVSAAARALGGYVLSLVTPLTVAAAAAAVLTFGYYKGTQEATAYSNAILMTGNAAGVSSGQLAMMAGQVAASANTTKGAAAEILVALTATGRVGEENLARFAGAAEEAQRRLNLGVDTTVEAFANLGKSPLETSRKLNDQYRYLTASVYDQIVALEQQGRVQEAANIAQNAFYEAISSRAGEAEQNLGTIERLWSKIKGAVSSAGDAIKGIGRADPLEAQLATIEAKIAANKTSLFRATPEARNRLQEWMDEKAVLESQIALERQSVANQAEAARLAEATTKWTDLRNQHLSKTQQMENEIAKATNMAKAAGISVDDESFKQVIASVRQKYVEVNKTSTAALEAGRALQKQVFSQSLADLESSHRQRRVSEQQYITAKRDLQVKDLDNEIAYTKRLATLASGKDQLDERTKLLGQVKVLEAQRAAAIRQAESAIQESAAASTKLVIDQSKAWANAAKNESEQLQIEVSLFGQSAQARAIAVAQARVDVEVRQLIAAAQAKGQPLTQKDIEQLTAEAEARKRNIATIESQRQAMAGAEQLRQENRRFAAESILDETQRAAALLEIDADMWRERIRMAGEGTEAQRLLQEEFDQWYANRKMAPVVDKWKGIVSSLDSTFRDGFRNMLESGTDAWKSFAKSIGNTLKTTIADALYQAFAKKYVVQFAEGLAGMGSGSGSIANLFSSGSGASASGGFGSMANLMSIGKAIYQGFAGGLSGGIGSFVSGFGNLVGSQGISAFGTGMGLTGSQAATAASAYGAAGNTTVAGGLTAGSSAGAYAIPIAGWIAAGMTVANNLYKQGWDMYNGSVKDPLHLGSGIKAFDGLLRGIGLSNTAANIFSGQSTFAALFGRKNPQVEAFGIEGGFSADGFSGTSYQNILEKGGLFRSDKRYVNSAAVDAATDGAFDETIKSMLVAVKGFGAALGIETAAIDSYSKQIKLTLTKDEEQNKKLIAEMFGGIGNELSTLLVPSIASLSKAGEDASATLQRVAINYQALDEALKSVGMQFGAVGVDSLAARERLIDASGGMQVLSQNVASFAQHFMTEAERLAPVQAYVASEMARLGMASVDTAEEFKAAVLDLQNGGKLATEEGANLFAALMKVEGAFALVHPMVDKTAEAAAAFAEKLAGIESQRTSMADQLAQLQDPVAYERSKVDPSNHDIHDQIKAQRAANDLAAINKGWSDKITEFIQSQKSVAEQRADEIELMDDSTKVLAQRYYALLDEKDAEAARLKQMEEARLAAEAAQQAMLDRFSQHNSSLSQSTAQVVAAQTQVSDLANERAEMEWELYQLTHTAAEVLAESRRRELAAMDETLRPIQLQINAQKDMASAAEQAAQAIEAAAARARAIESERMSIQRDIWRLEGNVVELRKDELAQLDPSNRALKEQFWAKEKQIEQERQAAQMAQAMAQAAATAAADQARAAEAIANAWQSATDSIFAEVDRIRGIDSVFGGQSAASEARFQIALAQARAGDLEALKALPQLAQNMTQLLKSTAGSDFELRSGLAKIAGSLEQVGLSNASRMRIKVPSFDVGADVLPADMLAMVHAGEGILTKRENAAFNSFINDPASTMVGVVELLELLRQDILSSKAGDAEHRLDVLEHLRAIALNTLDVKDMQQRWETLGTPPVREELEA